MTTIETILTEERTAEQTQSYNGFTIAMLRQVFEKVQNPEGWKKEWTASVPHQLVKAVMVAVEFFHADKPVLLGIEPLTGNVLMQGNGYRAY